MKSIREQLSRVSCEPGCANCCPKTCRQLTPKRLCQAHPAVIGAESAALKRGMKCEVKPLEIMSWGYYCPPIVKLLEMVTGAHAYEEIQPNGQHGIRNFKEFANITREARGLRKR